jgi:hypothetical protein
MGVKLARGGPCYLYNRSVVRQVLLKSAEELESYT